MKKIFFSFLAIAAIASCAKTEVVYTEADSEIKIAPVTSTITKADVKNAIDGTVYPTAEEFMVNAFYNDASKTNVQYLANVVFTNKGQYWGGQDATYYWPKNGTLSFACYSPADLPTDAKVTAYDVATDTYTVAYAQPATTAETVDFLIAPITVPYTAQTATENVSVVFEHALAWVTIKVKAANPEAAAAFTIKDVIVNQVATTGTLTAEMGDGIQYTEWSDQDTPENYDVVKGKEIDVTTVATNVEENENGTLNGLVVVPQVPTTLTINYTQNAMTGTPELDAQTVTVPLELDDESNNFWEPGKHYIYTVIFDLDEILINPSVVDWEDVVVEDKEADNAGQIATVATYEELVKALEATVPEIELTADIDLEANLAVDYSVAFAGGGFTGAYTITVTGPVVSFEKVAFANATGEKQTSVYVYTGNTNVTFQNCTFDNYVWEAIQYTSENGLWVCVDGCTFNATAYRDLHLQVKNASKAEVKITNNRFKGTDENSYVTVYGFEHERMILANNTTEESANTVNVWISDAFDWNNLTLVGFVVPTTDVPATLKASTILAGNATVASLALAGYDLDGAGYTVTMDKASTENYFVTTNNGFITNVNLVGYNDFVEGSKEVSIRGIMIAAAGNVVLNNVTITDFGYALNTNGGTKDTYTLTVVNSTLEGWTSFDTFKSATFINTNFKVGDYFTGSSYDDGDSNTPLIYNGLIKAYIPTTLEGCSFDKGFTLDFTAGGSYTLTGCTVDGVELNEENYTAYLTVDGDATEKITF